MLRKKHYEALARIIGVNVYGDGEGRLLHTQFVAQLMAYLEEENPNFDAQRFENRIAQIAKTAKISLPRICRAAA